MPFPWSSFGAFKFQRREQVLHDTDSGWSRTPAISQQRPLGSAIDSIVTLAVGSAVRTFECYLTPARFITLEALVNTSALFTDWDRPTPDSRQAFLRRVSQVRRTDVLVRSSNGVTPNSIRARVELVSQ